MVIVFGSINADGVMRAERLPVEGETRLDGEYQIFPGGKGANQALAAARAGAEVAFVGSVGDDPLAATALAGLEAAGIDLSKLAVARDVSTGYASVMVNHRGENAITVASGANQRAKASQLPDPWLTDTASVLLQLEVPMQENVEAISRAKRAGCRTLINLAPYATPSPGLIENADIIVMNEIEAAQLAADRGGSADIFQSADALHREFANVVVLTLGKDGVVAFAAGKRLDIPAHPITPIDTTGAGDAFVGCLAAALDAGEELPEALHRAAVAGSLACLTLGAQSALPSKAEIDSALTGGISP